MKPKVEEELLLTFILIISCLLLGLIVGIVSTKEITLELISSLGSLFGGVAAVFGVPYLILNFKGQRESIENFKEEKDLEARGLEFKRHCESVNYGLSLLKCSTLDTSGASGLIKLSDQIKINYYKPDRIIKEFGEKQLLAVAASLQSLVFWINSDEKNYLYHPFFRVRYISIILSLESLLTEEEVTMSKKDIFTKWGNDNSRHALVLSLRELRELEFTLWTNIQIEANE